jgi:hypothetical protein
VPMNITIEAPIDAVEAKANFKFFATALAIGFAVSLLAIVFVRSEPERFLAEILSFVAGGACLAILASAVSVARDPSLRRLSWIGVVTALSPWSLAALTQVAGLAVEHDAGGFSLVYFMLSCTIAGLGLLLVACARFLQGRRKRKVSN